MAKTKVLITVKTYPSISKKYKETVCTAGIKENGEWIRIYPVPFRQLPYAQQYPKYQWIEMNLVRNTSDFRPESYKPQNIDAEDLVDFGVQLDTKNKWAKRKEIVLKNICTDLTKLIEEAKKEGKYTSLAVFKPRCIKDFIIENQTAASGVQNKKQLYSKGVYLKINLVLKL